VGIIGAIGAELVRLKLAGNAAPVAAAVTVYGPDVEFAVKVDDVTAPVALVMPVSVSVPLLAKMALAPDDGAVKVTATPLAGAPFEVTVATRGAAKAAPTVEL
jgi:hypothetical protein